jgi:hypothetical protein
MKSLFLLEPIFDSGCAICSNKDYKECGFEKWGFSVNSEKYKNKGMTWAFYESENNDRGISVINVCFNNDNCTLADVYNLNQLVSLKNKLDITFSGQVSTYETYITGDFHIPFNMSCILSDVDDTLTILKNANIKIISNPDIASSTCFIMYSGNSNSQFTYETENTMMQTIIARTTTSSEEVREIVEDVIVKIITDIVDEEVVENPVATIPDKNIKIDISEIRENYFDTNIKSGNSSNSEDWEHV